MIEIKDLYKKFGKFEVLKDINLNIEDKNIIALLGPNASGKTTLIKTILGMVIPDKGEITVNQKKIKNNWTYREEIGYMPQIGKYPENMKAGQVLEMISDIRFKNHISLDNDLYNSFKINEILNKKMGTLSGGTKQKFGAYLAFLFNPNILILDEPTAGLDPISSIILKEKIIAEKEKGKLVIISSHILSDLDDVVTQVVYMKEGTISFNKSMSKLKQETSQDRLNDILSFYIKNNSAL